LLWNIQTRPLMHTQASLWRDRESLFLERYCVYAISIHRLNRIAHYIYIYIYMLRVACIWKTKSYILVDVSRCARVSRECCRFLITWLHAVVLHVSRDPSGPGGSGHNTGVRQITMQHECACVRAPKARAWHQRHRPARELNRKHRYCGAACWWHMPHRTVAHYSNWSTRFVRLRSRINPVNTAVHDRELYSYLVIYNFTLVNAINERAWESLDHSKSRSRFSAKWSVRMNKWRKWVS